MIDSDLRVWLIEVNTNPYIGIQNTKMKNVLPDMLDSLNRIVIDPVLENLTPELEDNIWLNTGWEILYSRLRGVNKRREITYGIYLVKELALKSEF